jgi:hypothetical protein
VAQAGYGLLGELETLTLTDTYMMLSPAGHSVRLHLRMTLKRHFATAALCLGAGLVVLSRGTPLPTVDSARPTAPSAPLSGGINPSSIESSFVGMTISQQQSVIGLMKSDSVHWVRLDEPGNGAFAQRAEASGIQVDALINGSTSSPSSLASTCSEVVSSLKPDGVQTYEVLNEINLKIPATAYVPLLKACYKAIKADDPTSTVLSSGLSNATASEAPATYLNAMYAAGAKGYFDAVAMHPYGFAWVNGKNESAPMDPASWNSFYQLPKLYQVMKSNGDGGKKVWLTEYGCPTGTAGGRENPDGGAFCTDASLAEDITEAYKQANAWPWVGNLFIYSWQDASSGADGDFGLYDANGTPKAAPLAAFKAAVRSTEKSATSSR